MGRQPTGGYALELAEPPCLAVDDRLSIYVNWITPADGAAVTQMVTAPCMLLKFPRVTIVPSRSSINKGERESTAWIFPISMD